MSDTSSKKLSFKDKIDIAFKVIEVVIIAVSAFLIYKQIDQSNKLTWQTSIENTALELSKKEIEDSDLSCIYKYDIADIDESCEKKLKNPLAFRKVYIFIESLLGLFKEIKEYSKKYDREYIEYYKGWMEDVAELDITKYVLHDIGINEKEAADKYGIETKNIESGYKNIVKKFNLKNAGKSRFVSSVKVP
ncbi:MAG: hypothetical protein WC855_02530 [Thermodesulfovibrionales bacterium]